MVYGAKANKPANSKDPKHKRRISLLNSDFKIMSGIDNTKFKTVATHTLNSNQLSTGDDRRIHHGINKARDAINAATGSKEGSGILDNDYMSAFDLMVLTWVFKVLKAKGMSQDNIDRLKSMYDNHLTVVVINNKHGRCFPNKRWSIRQGDRPSSILFCYGLDPHLDWLEARLKGIPIYRDNIFNPNPEIYKLIAYVDDVKPSISNMDEFRVVDEGSALFERASGCKLHRDPASGKVKFLPLGRWKGTLTPEDLPVRYVKLSEHLDMVGVKLMANFQKTRKVNCDELQSKVQTITGAWRGGKFMCLTDRPNSLNTYCLPKVWFKCSSINLRACDFAKMNSSVKSWLFADLLEKPEDFVIYRKRAVGGLGLVNIQFKSLSLLIRSFLETAIIPKFKHNKFHTALFLWFVEGRRDMICPDRPAYYDEQFFQYIQGVKQEGLLNLQTMTSGMWYRVLLENHVTHELVNSRLRLKPCRAETKNPEVEWEKVWNLAITPGLPSELLSFLWKMIHNLLPCQTRLLRLNMPNITSNICTLCDENQVGDLKHSLMLCPFNGGAGQFLLRILQDHQPSLLPQQVVLLDLDVQGELQLPLVFLTSSILSQVWSCRMEKRPCHLATIRAALEASVNIMRRSRHSRAAEKLCSIST